MREWKFENGIEVYESGYDYDLHCLKVYDGERYLGTIYPSSIEEMNNCFSMLDKGKNPIAEGWEDGNGNTCTIDSWS